MIAALALLMTQVGVAVPPVAELKTLAVEMGFLTFDRAIDWSKVPGKKIDTKETDAALPKSIVVFNGELRSLAIAPYELAGEEPKWKLGAHPILKGMLGMKSSVSTPSNLQVLTTPNVKDKNLLDVEISFDPTPRKAGEEKPFPFVRKVTISLQQCIGLTFTPDPQKVEQTVQLIGIGISPSGDTRLRP